MEGVKEERDYTRGTGAQGREGKRWTVDVSRRTEQYERKRTFSHRKKIIMREENTVIVEDKGNTIL